jgi:hypothetical protein
MTTLPKGTLHRQSNCRLRRVVRLEGIELAPDGGREVDPIPVENIVEGVAQHFPVIGHHAGGHRHLGD